jgi:hypothetical protein
MVQFSLPYNSVGRFSVLCIKFNVNATSGSCNIKPIIVHLLPHVVDNFLISLHRSPSQNPTKRCPWLSDQPISGVDAESVIDMDGDEGASKEFAKQFSVR